MATALQLGNGMGRFHTLTLVLAVLVGGCTAARVSSESPADSHPAALPASTIAPDQRVVAYPHGRWLLYGDGTVASPYAWVWVPTRATPPPPAPPAR
jgi:hypothetical protein